MVSPRSSGWDGLEPEKLADLSRTDFERFCADLVHYEAMDRHGSPRFLELSGGVERYGDVDFVLTVREKAQLGHNAYQRRFGCLPLTEDELGRTAYLCEAGPQWTSRILDDTNRSGKPGLAVEILLEGGHFKLLTNRIGDGGDRNEMRSDSNLILTAEQHLAAGLHKRMLEVDPEAKEPSDRIEIVDADVLCRYVRGHCPEALDHWLDKLGLVAYLDDIEGWSVIHRHDREMPPYFPDDLRKRLSASIVEFLGRNDGGAKDRIAWLVGAPGSGKTRLLLELLKTSESLAQRVRFSGDASEVRDLLHGSKLLARHREAVIVVDDCPLELVGDLNREFIVRARHHPRAHMIVLTPMSPKHAADRGSPGIERRWDLEGLKADTTRELVSTLTEEPVDSRLVSDIVWLSEGYPWYAALLARESRESGSHPRTSQEAAMLGLASDADDRAHPQLRRRRARALLAVSMTRKVDWDALGEDNQRRLAHAIGLQSFEDLRDAARECYVRGILRLRLGWKFKYVTPLILEREVLKWLLGSAGDGPGGPWLMQHAREYVGELFDTVLRLDLPQDVGGTLAEHVLNDLQRAPASWSEVISMKLLGEGLLVAARYLPGHTSKELRRRVKKTSLDELMELQDGRRQLVFALEELSSRQASFEDAEDALFRLAQAENEPYSNNATGVWAGLFSVGMNVTHRSTGKRLSLLKRRLNDSVPAARLVALSGLSVAIDQTMWRTVPQERDGAWPVPTLDEQKAARAEAWSLLTARFDDDDEKVASRARKNAIDGLRRAVQIGDGEKAMEAIASQLQCFTELERVKLAEMLKAVRRYDLAYVDASGQHPGALEQQLAPRSYRDKLKLQVGVWRPEVEHNDLVREDERIAEAGLAGDRPLVDELDWLVSDEAVRGLVFSVSVGTQDKSGSLVEDLKLRTRTIRGSQFLAGYLEGWKKVGGRLAADAVEVLEELAGDAELADAFALSLINVCASKDDHLTALEAALRENWLTPTVVYELGRRRPIWLTETSPKAQESLIATMLKCEEREEYQEHAAAVLELVLGLLRIDSARENELQGLLLKATERLSTGKVLPMTQYHWRKAAEILCRQGQARRIAELAVNVIAESEVSSTQAWEALNFAANEDPSAAWSAIAATLRPKDVRSGALLLEFKFNRQANLRLPEQEVLEWVGESEPRGRLAAMLFRPHDETLHPILVALIRRFGAYGSVAGVVSAGVHSTNGLVASLAAHAVEQLRHAQVWKQNPDPEISAFGKRLVESLEESRDRHAAEEELEQREMDAFERSVPHRATSYSDIDTRTQNDLDLLLSRSERELSSSDNVKKSHENLDRLISRIQDRNTDQHWFDQAVIHVAVDESTRNPWLERHAFEITQEDASPVRSLMMLLKLHASTEVIVGDVHAPLREEIRTMVGQGDLSAAARLLWVLYDLTHGVDGDDGRDTEELLREAINHAEQKADEGADGVLRAVSTFLAAYPPFVLVQAREAFRAVSRARELGRFDDMVLRALR